MNLGTFNTTIREFARKLSALKAPTVAFYYAGHGAQVEGRNYFFPVDFKPAQELKTSIVLDTIDVNLIVDLIEKGNPHGRNLFFLDGCRDNPLERETNVRLEASSDLPKGVIGLTKIGENSIVVFSTPPGATAFDTLRTGGVSELSNSPFARGFASALVTPGLDFIDFFTKIQFAVLESTFGRQKPVAFGTMPKQFSIASTDGTPSRGDFEVPLMRAKRVAFDSAGGDPVFAYSGSYALLIGETIYRQKVDKKYAVAEKAWPDLPGVKDDIQRIDRVLREQHGFETTVVWDADYDQLQDAFRRFFSVHGRKDDARLLVYYAGHGHTSNNYGISIGWIVPSDAPNPALHPEEFALTALSMRRIEEYSEFVKAKHILWMFDSCFSGSIFAMNMRGQSDASLEKELFSRPIRRVITSGSQGEQVPDKSVFADLLVGALQGTQRVGREPSVFTANELGEWLHKEVFKYRRGKQTPQNGTVVIRGLDQGEILFRLEDSLSKSQPKAASAPN